jgi:hypothetical protein
VEPHRPTEQLSIDWATDETPAQAPARPVAAVEAGPKEAGRKPAGRSPIVLIATTGAIVGGIAMLAFVNVRPEAQIKATPPAAAIATAPTPAAIATAPAPAVVETIPPPTWIGSRRTSWASDGSKTITFQLAATRDLSVWMNKARPVLAARCLYHATEVFVVLDTSAGFEHDADRRTVRVQWDDEPGSVQQWRVSESGRELFAPDGKAVIERMATAHRLQFGFTPFHAEPVTAEFAVQGFERLAGLVTTACK